MFCRRIDFFFKRAVRREGCRMAIGMKSVLHEEEMLGECCFIKRDSVSALHNSRS